MKAILIDDEDSAIVTLKYLLTNFCPDVEIIAVANNVQEGLNKIKLHAPDIVFLDIELHDESGFSLLENLNVINFSLIFITAYNTYALKAIKFSAIDYLLKPVDIEELKLAVEKARNKQSASLTTHQIQNLLNSLKAKERSNIISISTMEGIHYVDVNDLIRCEADSSYTTFFLKSGQKILASKTLKEYEELLEVYGFVRIHHSHIIDLSSVKMYFRNDDTLQLKDGSIVQISSRKKAEVLEKLANLTQKK